MSVCSFSMRSIPSNIFVYYIKVKQVVVLPFLTTTKTNNSYLLIVIMEPICMQAFGFYFHGNILYCRKHYYYIFFPLSLINSTIGKNSSSSNNSGTNNNNNRGKMLLVQSEWCIADRQCTLETFCDALAINFNGNKRDVWHHRYTKQKKNIFTSVFQHIWMENEREKKKWNSPKYRDQKNKKK